MDKNYTETQNINDNIPTDFFNEDYEPSAEVMMNLSKLAHLYPLNKKTVVLN